MKRGSGSARKAITFKRVLEECERPHWFRISESAIPLAHSEVFMALEFAWDDVKATIYVAAYQRAQWAESQPIYQRLRAILKRHAGEIADCAYTYLNFAQIEQAHDLLLWQKDFDQWQADRRARLKGAAPQLALFGGGDD